MRSRFGPLLAWLAIQIATLWIGAMRAPLWAQAGNAPQHLALPEMIVVQLAISTMLFPMMVDRGIAAAIALTAIPFLQLAALLSATPAPPLVAISLAMLIWIFALALWGTAIRSTPNRMIAIAILNCIVIGGPLCNYLVQEFSDSPDQMIWKLPAACDPITSLVRQTAMDSLPASSFAGVAILFATGALTLVLKRSKFFRNRLSTSTEAAASS